MSDRFYTQRDNAQNKYFGKGRTMVKKTEKPKRRLKKDVVAHVNCILETEVSGLDRMTIASLEELVEALKAARIRWFEEAGNE